MFTPVQGIGTQALGGPSVTLPALQSNFTANAEAPSNIPVVVHGEPPLHVEHKLQPVMSWENATATLNIWLMSVTDDTSHPPMSWSNALAE